MTLWCIDKILLDHYIGYRVPTTVKPSQNAKKQKSHGLYQLLINIGLYRDTPLY